MPMRDRPMNIGGILGAYFGFRVSFLFEVWNYSSKKNNIKVNIMEIEQPPLTPTPTADAIKKAVLQLYGCEEFSVIGKLGSGFYANVYLVGWRYANFTW